MQLPAYSASKQKGKVNTVPLFKCASVILLQICIMIFQEGPELYFSSAH